MPDLKLKLALLVSGTVMLAALYWALYHLGVISEMSQGLPSFQPPSVVQSVSVPTGKPATFQPEAAAEKPADEPTKEAVLPVPDSSPADNTSQQVTEEEPQKLAEAGPVSEWEPAGAEATNAAGGASRSSRRGGGGGGGGGGGFSGGGGGPAVFFFPGEDTSNIPDVTFIPPGTGGDLPPAPDGKGNNDDPFIPNPGGNPFIPPSGGDGPPSFSGPGNDVVGTFPVDDTEQKIDPVAAKVPDATSTLGAFLISVAVLVGLRRRFAR